MGEGRSHRDPDKGCHGESGALTLVGPDGAYATNFSYNAATRIATWTPTAPITSGRLTIQLDRTSVVDTSNNPLTAGWARTFGVLAGDFDGNGIVDKKDLAGIKKKFTRKRVPLSRLADINGDGTVNQADLDIAKANLGKRLQ